MAQGDWAPTRAGAHPPKQTIPTLTSYEFAAPEGANGFYIGANGQLMLTLDGSQASPTNGLFVDPTQGMLGLVPVTPSGGISVFNVGVGDLEVDVAWLERLG